MKRRTHIGIALTLCALAISGCVGPLNRTTVRIASGSENRSLEPIVQRFARQAGYNIQIDYIGSVDMMLQMQDEDFAYDAVWPANSIWISLGDEQFRRIQHVRSIMTSPVVFGIRRSEAERLGFTDGEVTVARILDSIRDGGFSFMMTSATQSNSGATAYMGFLYALAQNPAVLDSTHLTDQPVVDGITELLGAIHRSSGSSGWLMDLFLESDYDAMVNYEALVIETNQELERRGREPLYVVYPADGLAIADSPLGYVDRGDEAKEEAFLALQNHLLSAEVQSTIGSLGRRTGIAALMEADPEVFQAGWGIDTERVLGTFTTPSATVIREALHLYQTRYRKPSFTVFALDYSGSMAGEGERELKAAMRLLLDPESSERYMLQPAERDVTVVLPFSDVVLDSWIVEGNDPQELTALANRIEAFEPGGGTDLYEPIVLGVQAMARAGDQLDDYQPAVILLTDGEHTDETSSARTIRDLYRRQGIDIPIFSIMFGNAIESELEELSEWSRARVFDGREDLVHAFRSAKGYN